LNQDRFLTLAAKALKKYDLADYQVEFIRQNENITCKVSTVIQNYLLRIHEPGHLNFWGLQHSFEGLESEKLYLIEMKKTTGLLLQEPVLNNHGDFVTTVYDNDKDKFLFCTLLTWIEGEKIPKDTSESVYAELGLYLAKMHNFSQNWQPPQGFARPVWNIQKEHNLTDRLEYGVEKELFSEGNLHIIKQAVDKIGELYSRAGTGSNRYGIIHADTNFSNVILTTEQHPALIDFSFSGFGYYGFDLGICMCEIRTEYRQIFLSAYQTIRKIDQTDTEIMNSGYILSKLGAYSFLISKPENDEYFKTRITRFIDEDCLPFLKNELNLC